MPTITSIKIHPAIGIARIGNSPTESFIGPEFPGREVRPKGGYKDSVGRIKRQVARFRLFGYDKNGKFVKEITGADAVIEWTVQLVNRKAAWKQFDGLKRNSSPRNGKISRDLLIIDPGQRTIVGPNRVAAFDTGTFLGVTVPLGDMRSDRQNRLLVRGGFGNSGSPANKPLVNFANNNGWFDDVSDGPVTATIKMKHENKKIRADGAWVICAPPKFAPGIGNVISLYDVLLQIAVDKLGHKVPAKPSFSRDIFPLIRRALDMGWVSAMITSVHAHGTLATIKAATSSPASRKAIFDRLRDPAVAHTKDSPGDMPMIWSDYFTSGKSQPLTKIQYNYMKRWKNGNFNKDWRGVPKFPKTITPDGLDRAALENCVGAALYPGIEASWMLRDMYKFSEPFRLDHSGLEAGDVTKQMAVPWQADFYDCTMEGDLAWWPAQRPDDVFPDGGGPQVPWIRQLVNSSSDMVKNWHRLGIIVKKGKKYVETERS